MTTATLSRTLYAPNPPQLDDPWLTLLVVLVLGFAGCVFAVGF